MTQHRESPIKRMNPSGQERWVARYTTPDGKRRSAGTFKLKRDAQDAIDRAYRTRHGAPETVGAYAKTWLKHHPRSSRTEECYRHRLNRALGLLVEGMPLRDHDLVGVRRRHAYELVDRLLRDQGRAVSGAVGILRVLSAMYEDAITDELAETNPFRGVRVRASDPRARKAPRGPGRRPASCGCSASSRCTSSRRRRARTRRCSAPCLTAGCGSGSCSRSSART